jgi:hypothetical protein
MATDTIRVGIKVVTARRVAIVRGNVVYLGGTRGQVAGAVRHPVTRKITAVIIDTGDGDENDNVVVTASSLRLAS